MRKPKVQSFAMDFDDDDVEIDAGPSKKKGDGGAKKKPKAAGGKAPAGAGGGKAGSSGLPGRPKPQPGKAARASPP